jgi:RNA polymerase sigma-70 factor (ECF subfamily)
MNRKRLNTLIKRAMAGEAAALEQLCQMYAKTILFQTRLLVKNKDDAEDVAQKVAIEMLRGIQKLRSPYAFRNWLQRLIVNACNKQNARTRHESERAEDLDGFADMIVDDSLEARPEEHFESVDLQRSMGGYLERLPPSQAIALTLFYYEQLSYKEVADTLGITVGAVSSTISKAKGNLKEMLKEKNHPGALGIVFLPSLFRSGPAQAVRNEIETSVSLGAVERFMTVCKTNIAAIATGAGVTVATTGALGTIIATSLGLAILGGTGVGAYLLTEQPTPEAPVIEQVQPTVALPDSRVTYSVAGEQYYDNPVDPLTVQFELISNETIDGWVLTDTSGAELAYGGGFATGIAPDAETDAGVDVSAGGDTGTDAGADTGAASESEATNAEGTFINVAALDLPEGKYTLTWYLTNWQGGKSHVYWEFFITSAS